jgi:hypothetical protein
MDQFENLLQMPEIFLQWWKLFSDFQEVAHQRVVPPEFVTKHELRKAVEAAIAPLVTKITGTSYC